MTAPKTEPEPELPFHAEGGGALLVEIVGRPWAFTEGKAHDLLTSAFEGGSNYWIEHIAKADHGRLTASPIYLQDWPLLGGALLFFPGEDPGPTPLALHKPRQKDGRPTWRLDRASVIHGAVVMAALKTGEGGHHWRAVLDDGGDADTGDCYLQCCLFGALVFG